MISLSIIYNWIDKAFKINSLLLSNLLDAKYIEKPELCSTFKTKSWLSFNLSDAYFKAKLLFLDDSKIISS